MNLRNLLTIEMLDRMRRTVLENEPSEDPERVAVEGAGTIAEPTWIRQTPFGQISQVRDLASELDEYTCEETGPRRARSRRARGPGPERVYRVEVDRAIEVRGLVAARDAGTSLYLLGDTPDPATCKIGGGTTVSTVLQPGVHHFVVETAGTDEDGQVLFVLDRP